MTKERAQNTGRGFAALAPSKLAALLAMLCLTASSCADTVCDSIFRHSLTLEVIDKETGAKVCDATIVITGSGSTEIVKKPRISDPYENAACKYAGISGAGDFHVSITREGFLDASRDVSIEPESSGECRRPIQQHLTVELERAFQ